MENLSIQASNPPFFLDVDEEPDEDEAYNFQFPFFTDTRHLPVLSPTEGPVLCPTEGPVLSLVEGNQRTLTKPLPLLFTVY